MQPGAERLNKHRQEHIIGMLLRAGVILAAIVVLAGGVLYLMQHGNERPNYRQFHGVPQNLQTVSGVVKDASQLRSEAVVQLGLLLLILTPVARVAFSAVSFTLKRDWMYVCITLIVLGVLLFSLFGVGQG